jgi:hypothetical protein
MRRIAVLFAILFFVCSAGCEMLAEYGWTDAPKGYGQREYAYNSALYNSQPAGVPSP